MNTLLLAIIGHLVGDYLLQTDWMALTKKQPGRVGDCACGIHSAIWTLSVCAFAGWWGWTVCIGLFYAHFWQDRTNVVKWWMTLPWKDQTKFTEPPMAPWSLIVVDNVWHIVSLYLVARFVV